MNTRTLKKGILVLILSTALHGVAGLPGNWEIRNSHFAGILNGVASAPGQVIAVGQGAAIFKSDNGIDWTRVPYNPGNGDFYCVTFGNGIYVAGGTSACLMAISSDGVNWTQIQSTAGIHANFGVTFARGRFVAIGRGTSPVPNCRLITSTNGIDWETAIRPTTNTLRAITFGNGKYIAVGDHGTIITSPDAINWTVQNSGTEHLLRSVIFTGRDFIAGGDSSSLLTSGDGISWVSVPFSSFDVKGLATCGTAVVAVGALNPGGRAQSSTDGLSWTNAVSSFPSGLNAIVQYDLGRFIAVGVNGLIIDSTAWADTPVNTWTKPTDGLWQEGYWSLGHVPSWKDASIVFTNAGSKTLEIDATTTRAYPDSMKLSAVILDAPEGSHNRLLLSNAGHDIPLQINGLTRVPAGATLEMVNSSFEAQTLHVNGHAVFGDDAQALFRDSIQLGVWDIGEVIQSNAVVSAGGVSVGTYLPGTWLQSGGALHAGGLGIGPDSVYSLFDGALAVDRNLTGGVAPSKLARLNINGGLAAVEGALVFYAGEIRLSGGSLRSSTIVGQNFSVLQTGGTNHTGRIEMPTTTQEGVATYVLADGRLESDGASLGQAMGARGSFVQNGGVHIATGSIDSFTLNRAGGSSVQGTYTLSGGVLTAPRMNVGGVFTQTGGTNSVPELSVWKYNLSGGSLTASNLMLEPGLPDYRGGFIQTGGEDYVNGELTVRGPYELQDGRLIVKNIRLSGTLRLAGGSVSNATISFTGGKILASGTFDLGQIVIIGNGGLDFQTGAAVLRFANSRAGSWAPDTLLSVSNWTQGANHLLVGSDQSGLSQAQLSRIHIVNPGGFSPGIYSARITPSGEVVPVPRLISYQRGGNNLVLAWPEGYRLFSATNVAGPYLLLTNAISPYTASYADPQRFFITANEN